jgi:hypothetical protein
VVAAMKRDLAALALNRFNPEAARQSFVASVRSSSLRQRLEAARQARAKR